MTTLVCSACGTVYKTRKWKPEMDEARCECGGLRVSPSQSRRTDRASKPDTPSVARQLKRGGQLKRTRRRETKAEREARKHFNDTVKAWPCWFASNRNCWKCNGAAELDRFGDDGRFIGKVTCPACDGDGRHHCSGRKDAHHLIPKNFIRKRFQGILLEPQFVAILFNPKIGAPVCRKGHEAVEAGRDRFYWEDLTDECIEYVGSLPDFMLLRLEEEAPKREVVR